MIQSNLHNYLSTLIESVLSDPGWFLTESLKDVFLPCLLSLVLAVLFKNVFPKPLWGVLWGALLIYFLGGLAQEGFRILWSESASSTCLLYGLLLLGLFLGCAFWGLHLQPKNWIHWLTVPALFAVSFVGNALYFGEHVIDQWGVVSHYSLVPSDNKHDADFQIKMAFDLKNESVCDSLLVKGDNFCNSFEHWNEEEKNVCQWQPLTAQQKEMIQKLKQSIEEFTTQYRTLYRREGFSSQTRFCNFREGRCYTLDFINSRFNGIAPAVAIENLELELLKTMDSSAPFVEDIMKYMEETGK